jgi:isoleucyl-tRNA synthetase
MADMFEKVSTDLNFPQREKETMKFWRENDTFRKSLSNREGCPAFVFYEGPPTANGMPTIGHAIARTMKDLICRYKTMRGYYVGRKAGWDTHGLPVELEVEKELGISGKKQIEEYGIEKFNQKCKESVFRYVKEWNELTERIGYWLDLDHPYVTLTNDYIESVWWSLKRFWEAGLLYQAHKVVPYCPRCGTPLSSHEVAQGYMAVEDPSIYVKLRLEEDMRYETGDVRQESLKSQVSSLKSRGDTYLLIWTTTPWTLPSNVAVAVGDDYSYVAVESDGEILILAEELLNSVFESTPKIIRKMTGAELVGKSYEPLFEFIKTDKKAYYVIAGDFVTLKEGTGIVHMAPAFGQDDYEMSKVHDLPVLQPVDLDGRFTEEVTPWAGMFVKDADPGIMRNLEERGLLFKKGLYLHDYPFCWRCDSPLLYYARSSWFIRTTSYKDKMIEENQKINWYPEHVKDGLFGNWLENNVDWAVGRERYWGTPLNIWICAECGKQHSVGSIEELKRLGNPAGDHEDRPYGDVPDDIELHRPYIDAVILTCPACGSDMRRVPEVIDCWFDAGSMHTGQWHYPFENEELFKRNFPADFICEAIDQTRGWFYNLLATSTFLYGQSSYKNCLVTEHVLGPDGKKMSKSKGNRIEPEEVLEPYGADALRWYFCISPPWTRRPLSKEAVEEVVKKFMGTLHNVYSFFVLYANIDNIDPAEHTIPVADRPDIDRWIISMFHGLVDTVRKNMDAYQVSRATRAIADFVESLSNWYVRRCRDRYWGPEMDSDKIAAYKTLYEVLVELSKLISPYVPFMAEEIYQNLVRSVERETSSVEHQTSNVKHQTSNTPESVHLCDYPVFRSELIDKKLEEDMAYVRQLVVLARAARNHAGIKTRQPLSRMVVSARIDEERQVVERLKDLMVDEINVKSVEFADDVSQFISFALKPVFSFIGRKYGKLVPKIVESLSHRDPADAKAELERDGVVKLHVNGEAVELLPEEVEITVHDREGYVTETEGEFFVALSTQLSKELIQEGFAREIVNKVQFMRKEADFNVTDRIRLNIATTPVVLDAFKKHEQYIRNETLSTDVTSTVVTPTAATRIGRKGVTWKEWVINGEEAVIGVEQMKPQMDTDKHR